jgi:hypothetical protein
VSVKSHNVARSVAIFAFAAVSAMAAQPPSSPVRPDSRANKQVEIKTPWGSFQAKASASQTALGLPLYPGAEPLKNEGSAPIHADLSIGGKPTITLVVGKFSTKDGKEKVRAFYQKELSNKVTKFTERADDGSTVFEMKHKAEQKYVSLKTIDGRTEIDLVRIEGVEDEKK